MSSSGFGLTLDKAWDLRYLINLHESSLYSLEMLFDGDDIFRIKMCIIYKHEIVYRRYKYIVGNREVVPWAALWD